MSKWEKLLSRLDSLDAELRFEELRKILESYGYEMKQPHSGSSHYTFRKTGKPMITLPKHSPMKKIYIRLVRDIVEAEEERK